MAIYFTNSGDIDLDVIRTMGVNVKENDNPIGEFGTGLKYALATLLRTGHEVSLFTEGRLIEFSTREKLIRGKPFQMIFMDDEQLGFTTDLGKNWEVWQAYRELYSNTLDEAGTISYVRSEGDTIFTVKGEEIGEVHAERGKIFLQNEPWIVSDGVEIYRGQSQYIYYRGVRVHQLVKPTRFTYNFTCPMRLTEDRTLASTYDLIYKMGTLLPKVPDPVFSRRVVDPAWDGFERNIDFSDCASPSDEFLDSIEQFVEDAHLKPSTRDLLKAHRDVIDYVKFTPSDAEWETIRDACSLLKSIHCFVEPTSIIFVETLGPGIVAQALDGDILITRQCLANGVDFLAITIYEEWIHNNMGYHDCSRSMQQFLFDKILELAKRSTRKEPK